MQGVECISAAVYSLGERKPIKLSELQRQRDAVERPSITSLALCVGRKPYLASTRISGQGCAGCPCQNGRHLGAPVA